MIGLLTGVIVVSRTMVSEICTTSTKEHETIGMGVMTSELSCKHSKHTFWSCIADVDTDAYQYRRSLRRQNKRLTDSSLIEETSPKLNHDYLNKHASYIYDYYAGKWF